VTLSRISPSFAAVLLAACTSAFAQTSATGSGSAASTAPAAPALPVGVVPPPDYVIGAEDILTIVFWREKELSSEAVVRPDGKVSLPLLNDVVAAGLTPEQLRVRVTEAAAQLIEEPTVTVIVKQINSRKVFITGQIAKPGPYAIGAPMTVLQLISMAGGVNEFADSENINIVRTENGKTTSFRFNYEEVARGRKLEQNILLRPNDTIVVPQ
jgi:polysaccharide export outer membrane protein